MIQTALLSMLTLLLGFTFSQALQRYDSRGEAVIDEAMRSAPPICAQIYFRPRFVARFRCYCVPTWMVVSGRAPFRFQNEWSGRRCLRRPARTRMFLWRYALEAAEQDPNPVTSGLFIKSLNALIELFRETKCSTGQACSGGCHAALVWRVSPVLGHRRIFRWYRWVPPVLRCLRHGSY